MTDINQQEDAAKHLRFVQIILNHLAPLCLDLNARARVAVAWQIDVVKRVVDMVKIDRLGLARLRGCSRIGSAVHQRIDQGRFADV